MSEKKGRKRSKAYYIKCAHGGKKAKHVNDLDTGMAGFLVSCNKYERETVREMYNLLNEYADKLYGPEKPEKTDGSDNDSSDEDMEKAMQKETAEIKSSKQDVRRFQNTDTKTKNLIFIRTTLENPCQLAHAMLSDIFESQVQKARYALRMLPISITCKANINQIDEAARTLFKQDFETSFGVGVRFTSICKIRNNNSVSRTAILPVLGRVIQELNPLHTLCHDEPDVVIVIEVIRNICCLSVVKDYFKFKKYNLHEIISTPDGKGQVQGASLEKTSEVELNGDPLKEETKTVNDDTTKTDVPIVPKSVGNTERLEPAGVYIEPTDISKAEQNLVKSVEIKEIEKKSEGLDNGIEHNRHRIEEEKRVEKQNPTELQSTIKLDCDDMGSQDDA